MTRDHSFSINADDFQQYEHLQLLGTRSGRVLAEKSLTLETTNGAEDNKVYMIHGKE